MARIWIEPYRGSGVPMEYWGPEPNANSENLIVRKMLAVEVASFTFRFVSTEQIEDCLAYYERKTHHSSRLRIGSADHWEVQRWFERLPMYLLEESKRDKVVKALRRALALARSGVLSATRPT